jgi:NADH:ubiquinone oxidoreductase subunit 5 (subunit L)/multisubunit Na+/H+ antiporter MnhA subunit
MSLLIISLPLFSSLFLFFLGKFLGNQGSKIFSNISIIGIILISIKILINYNNKGEIIKLLIINWFNIGIININLELFFSKEAIIMINLINIITGIVIIYSYYYMNNEYNLNKFISYLFSFSVIMSLLVLSNNFISLFIGWEFVGLMSFLLINFWFTSINSNKSAFKAILFNKIGDISFFLALIFLYYKNYYNINSPFLNSSFYKLLFFFFLIAAFAKSALFLFHCWLSDAMAGPTPVSALLHAATMVTAGVYILIKISINDNMENNWNKEIIIIMGILTIIFASLNAIYNKDIKKIIAFSTASQLGFMIINLGFSSINKINEEFNSFFHLFTHGFFKALLFLTSGIIIHNFLNEQDIRKLGSLLFKYPFSYILFLIGSLTIIATPYLSGYYSKEIILFNSYFINNISIFILLIIGSILTIIYSLNLLFKTYIDFPSSSSLLLLNNINSSINKIKPELFTKKNSNYYYYFLFYFLIFFSITIGFFTSSYFQSPYYFSLINSSNWINIPSFFRELPLNMIGITILILLIYFNFPFINSYIYFKLINPKNIIISNYFYKKGFFDYLINYFLSSPLLLFSYNLSFKIFEKGYLEYFGPLGFFRLIYYFPFKYNINIHQTDSNSLTYIFIFLSFSFFLLIPFLSL